MVFWLGLQYYAFSYEAELTSNQKVIVYLNNNPLTIESVNT